MDSSATVTGSSLHSFDDAIQRAFDQVPGHPAHEGFARAGVARMWLTKGGVVGVPQYHVELSVDRQPPVGGGSGGES